MKKILYIPLVLMLFVLVFAGKKYVFDNKTKLEYQNGDMILQTNTSGQGLAIQLATNSKYTHIGVLFKENNEWMVYEAVQPVQKVTLSEFILRGENSQYTILRLKNDSLVKLDHVTQKMKNYLLKQIDKDYDWVFNWSEEEMYCSELVYKAYLNAGIKISDTKLLKDYKLSHPIVQAQLKERYGNNIPLNDTMVAPSDIANGNRLKVVFDNY
jgi:uncharacterized protein YycO